MSMTTTGRTVSVLITVATLTTGLTAPAAHATMISQSPDTDTQETTPLQQLNTAINDALTIGDNNGRYTADSYQTFTKALENAQTVAANDKATEREQTDATKALVQAQHDLEAINPRTRLESLQAILRTMTGGGMWKQYYYSDKDYQALQQADNQSAALLKNEHATDEELSAQADTVAKLIATVKPNAGEQLDEQITRLDTMLKRKPWFGKTTWEKTTRDAASKELKTARKLAKDENASDEDKAKESENLFTAISRLKPYAYRVKETGDIVTTSKTLTWKTSKPVAQITIESSADDMKTDAATVTKYEDKSEPIAPGRTRVTRVFTTKLSDHENDKRTLTMNVEWETGSVLTVDGTPVTQNKQGEWMVNLTRDDLKPDGTPNTTEITLSDGSTGTLTYGGLSSQTVKDTLFLTRIGTATITSKDGYPIMVTVSSRRTWSGTVNLNVERVTTGDDGKASTVTIPIPGMNVTDPAQLPATVTLPTLPYSTVGDSYRIAATHGSDVSEPQVKATIDKTGRRVFTVTVNWRDANLRAQSKTVTIIQPFTAAPRQSDNPKAALAGITVNGRMIDGWDPNVLEYTITGAGKFLVEPVAREGQSVSAGSIRQTAYTTVQEWTVTMDGQTRTYTVTLVRPHSEKTVVDSFTPNDPSDVQSDDGKRPTGSPLATGLKSVGYLLNNEYHPLTGNNMLIPEHGVLRYEAYRGQTVSVTGTRVKGMTWRYTFTILSAPDETGATRVGEQSITVTYVTNHTHTAVLTGVRFDGKSLREFKPERHEYTVQVNDPHQYVIVPAFDKLSGMSVMSVKTDDGVTVTVTSADGLVTTRYVFHVRAKSLLASTGATLPFLPASLFTLLGVSLLAARRHHRVRL